MTLAPGRYQIPKKEQSELVASSGLAGLAFCLGLGALLRLGTLWAVDLRGAFGPDAPGAVAAAVTGPLGHPYPLHPGMIALLSFSGNPLAASLLLSLIAGMATVAAGWSLGRTLGLADGRAVGSVAAVAPLLVYVSLLRGGDALAIALSWWGVALVWSASQSLGEKGRPAWREGLRMVAGCLLWGLSAAAKPVALPAGVFLLVAPMLGGGRCLPWLGAGLAAGLTCAFPFLGPLLRPFEGGGLLGSWWHPGPPADLQAWMLRPQHGIEVLVELLRAEPWAQLGPLALLALLGVAVRGPRRPLRLVVLLLGLAAVTGLAVLMGTRLHLRYLASATLGWTVLAGIAVTPLRQRLGKPPDRPGWSEILPLSLLVTLFAIADLRFWDGLSAMREQEEGSLPAREPFRGWAGEWRPVSQYADCSICGALQLESTAHALSLSLPEGSWVVSVPLRDGRGWHLQGPLAATRPDLRLVELDAGCCPHEATECAALLPGAMAEVGGGVLVGPMSQSESCATGYVAASQVSLWLALAPLLESGTRRYGLHEVPPAPSVVSKHLCEILGGRVPEAPARP